MKLIPLTLNARISNPNPNEQVLNENVGCPGLDFMKLKEATGKYVEAQPESFSRVLLPILQTEIELQQRMSADISFMQGAIE